MVVQGIVISLLISVGKTSLLQRFVCKKFSPQLKTTVGADFHTRNVDVGDKSAAVQIWDTAGQERYQSLCFNFYKGSECCFIVYDVTSAESFEALPKWHSEFLKRINTEKRKFPFVVLGNKHDLKEKRVISKEQGQRWANSVGAEFFETSAKDMTGVEEAFMKAVNMVFNYSSKTVEVKNNKEKESTKLHNIPERSKDGCPC